MSRSYKSPAPRFPFEQWSLPALLAFHSQNNSDRVFIRWTHEGPGLTFAAGARSIAALAGAFGAAGIGPGDRVVLYMKNSLMHVWCWLALNSIGAVDAPVNPAYFGDLLAYQIKLVRPKTVIVDEALQPRIEQVRAAIDPDETVRFLVNTEADPQCVDDPAGALGLTTAQPVPVTARDPREPATILFTSGTTGPSKGVRMPNAQMYFYSEQTVQLHRMTADDVYMAPYPLFHASARIHGVGSALVSGAECVLYDKFSATRFAERAARSHATVTHFLGSMMTRIMDVPMDAHDRASSLRSVMALPTPHLLRDAFSARFGVNNLCEVIGMTEASWTVMSPYGEERPRGAAGLAVSDWYDVGVVDPATDREVPAGMVGELVVRPKHPWIMFTEYENAPDRTVDSFRNLWFHTGDLVRRDADGWFYFVDRLKDSIRKGGENISSYDVEQVLLSCAGIADAAVVGIRAGTEEMDEEIRAFVVPDPDTVIEWPRLLAHMLERLPRHCLPRYYDAVRQLPMTPSGKVQKAELRSRPLDDATVHATS